MIVPSLANCRAESAAAGATAQRTSDEESNCRQAPLVESSVVPVNRPEPMEDPSMQPPAATSFLVSRRALVI